MSELHILRAIAEAACEKLMQEIDEHKAENARLKAENERLRKAGEWQPIETAPKDGITETLVMDCGHVYIGIFDKNGFCEDLHCAGLDPTHWMPLPNPPAAKDGKPTP
jgi:regulator of replication initiation timing